MSEKEAIIAFLNAYEAGNEDKVNEIVNSWTFGDLSLVKLGVKINDQNFILDIFRSSAEKEAIKGYLGKKKDVSIVANLLNSYFFIEKNVVYFGSEILGTKRTISPKEVVSRANNHQGTSYNSYQLMTLREVNRPLYERATAKFPKLKFFTNKTLKEFVRLEVKNQEFEDFVAKKWKGDLRTVHRPYNYQNRNYVDMTEPLLKEFFGSAVVIVENEEDLVNDELDEDEQKLEEERNTLIEKTRKEIEARLVGRYPKLKEIVEIVKKQKLDLLIEEDYLLPGFYQKQEELVYLPKRRLCGLGAFSVKSNSKKLPISLSYQ